MQTNIIFSMLPLTLIYATPIIIAALGGLMSERSGVVNIALEGMMMVGGFIAGTFVVTLAPYFSATWTPIISILLAAVFGAVFSIIHAFVCVNLKADQIICGTALNLLAGGITIFFSKIFFNQERTPNFNEGFTKTADST